MPETTMPLTAKDALALWDAGEAVPGFQVETSPERQMQLYMMAFEMIRIAEVVDGEPKIGLPMPMSPIWGEITMREHDVAHSIAYVALKSGWAKMVSQHIHRDSPAVTVKKPKD